MIYNIWLSTFYDISSPFILCLVESITYSGNSVSAILKYNIVVSTNILILRNSAKVIDIGLSIP
jgi:hypothetical protein